MQEFGPDTRARLHMDDPRNGMVAWIAMKGDEVVSHASVLFDKAHPDHSLLSGVTAPEHRRKGLSRELTRRTLQTFDGMTDGPGKYCILGTGSPFAAESITIRASRTLSSFLREKDTILTTLGKLSWQEYPRVCSHHGLSNPISNLTLRSKVPS